MTTKITEQNISELANAGVNWQSVFTGDGSTGLTAVAGRGYFIDTTSGTVTVTLPASPSAGDVVVLKDYARTWGTNAVSIASTTFDGVSNNPSFSTEGQTITLVYMDGTKGWSLINEDTTTGLGAEFISATGGTVTTSGDFKIHTFTGDGCFVVSSLGNPAGGGETVDYLVVAGGGAGTGNPNANSGGGGGAGGFRESKDSTLSSPHTASPLANTTGLTITATTYPITVGAGGSGALNTIGTNGSNSVFSTITSAGGGRGGGSIPIGPAGGDGASGGSGGGAGGGSPVGATGGTGNTPPTSPSQGNDGGDVGSNTPDHQSGGGGGAGGVGGAGTPANGGTGGVGVSTSITGSPLAYSGGGGGSGFTGSGGPSPCGTGGNGVIGGGSTGGAGTTNRGGGGGAAEGYDGGPGNATGGAGGKGIVILRYKFQ
jgi:hypothetical protein